MAPKIQAGGLICPLGHLNRSWTERKVGEQKDRTSVFLLEDEGNKSVLCRVQNVPVGTGRSGDFPQAVLPREVSLFPLCRSPKLVFSSLYGLIILSSPRQHVKTSLSCTHWTKQSTDRGGRRQWDAWSRFSGKKRKRPFPPLPHSFYFILSCGQETTVPHQKGESRKTENIWKGEGEEKAQEK